MAFDPLRTAPEAAAKLQECGVKSRGGRGAGTLSQSDVAYDRRERASAADVNAVSYPSSKHHRQVATSA